MMKSEFYSYSAVSGNHAIVQFSVTTVEGEVRLVAETFWRIAATEADKVELANDLDHTLRSVAWDISPMRKCQGELDKQAFLGLLRN